MAENKKLWGIIIAAVLGLLGTFYQANKTDPVRVPAFEATLEAEKTLTAIATLNAGTPSPADISTSEPSLAPAPLTEPSPPERPSESLERGCISEKVWKLYSSDPNFSPEAQDGCYSLLDYGISARQGSLSFVRSKVRAPETYGLLVSIPNNAGISFELRINNIKNAEVWVGIAQSPRSWAGKYLRSKANGNFDIATVVNSFPTYGENYYEKNEPDVYKFEYLVEGNLWTITYDSSPAPMFSDLTLNFSSRYLFVGFRAYPQDGISGSLDVCISDLVIEAK